MTSNYIDIERPGGQKKPPLRWDNEILIIGFVVFWLVIVFASVIFPDTNFLKSPLRTAIFLGSIALIVPFIFTFVTRNHKKLDDQYKHYFSQFGNDVWHCAPTHLGWIACGEDWIGASINPIYTTTLHSNDIGNVYWGGPRLVQSQLVNGYPFEIDMRKISPVSNLYWLLVLAKNEPNRSVFVTFRKKSEMETWVKIACNLASVQPNVIARPRSQPTKWQFACKAKLIPLTIILVQLLAYGLFMCLFATNRLSIGSQFLFPIMMFTNVGFMFPNEARGMSSKMTHDMLVKLNGGDGPDKDGRVPVIAGKNLILNHTKYPGFEWAEQIPGSDIKEVSLEDWGKYLVEQNLKQLFKKNRKSDILIVRLMLNRSSDNEREVKLARDDAIAWHKTLSELVAAK